MKIECTMTAVKCLFAAMVMIIAASCQKEDGQDRPGGRVPRIITAALANNAPQSRTHLGGDDGKKTLWSEGDTIWISDASNHTAKVQLLKGEAEPMPGYVKGLLSEDEKTFTFEVPAHITGTLYAVYPAFAQNGISSGKINVNIPTTQSGKFADANISVARESSNFLQFKNATAVMKFIKVSGDGKRTVYLASDKQLGGMMRVGYGTTLTVTPSNPEKTGVCAPFAEGDTACYVAVAPGEGTSYSVVVENATDFVKTDKGSKILEVNKIYLVSVIDMTPGTAFPEYSGANSFIISRAGHFSFDAKYKGNSKMETVGDIDRVDVLWESFGTANVPVVSDIISGVRCVGEKVSFTATGNEGNAVVAAKDAGGNILWSWHIWCTDQPAEQEYNLNAGTMMDRNLGATSAAKGSVGALGLQYQWGRKDPFLGSSSISSGTKAKSTGSWPSTTPSTAGAGTIPYAVQHPMQFITINYQNHDWYYTGNSSTDNTRWQTSNKDKGLYDPCPAGWRVPDGGPKDSSGVWATGFDVSSYWKTTSNWDGGSRGMDFGKTDKKLIGTSGQCWYPAAGYLDCADASLDETGAQGGYWSCTPKDYYAYFLYIINDGTVSPLSTYYAYRAYAQSVRCVREED